MRNLFKAKRKIANGFHDLEKDPTVHFDQQGDPFFSVGAANVVMQIDAPGGLLVMHVRPAEDKVISNAERMRIAQHMQATLQEKGYHTAAYSGEYGDDSVVVAINELSGEPRSRLEKYRDVEEAAERAAAFLQEFESTNLPPSAGRG